MRLGLVDRLSLILCPVTIGDGLPMLPRDVRQQLRRQDVRRYADGMVRLTYDVA